LHKAAGSSVLDGWDDIEEDLGDSTWPSSSLTSSPAEAEGTGEMGVKGDTESCCLKTLLMKVAVINFWL
jgi:hypothetical protein